MNTNENWLQPRFLELGPLPPTEDRKINDCDSFNHGPDDREQTRI